MYPAENGVHQQSVLELSWKQYPAAAMAACMTAVATLWWPDENVGKASNYLRYFDFHATSLRFLGTAGL